MRTSLATISFGDYFWVISKRDFVFWVTHDSTGTEDHWLSRTSSIREHFAGDDRRWYPTICSQVYDMWEPDFKIISSLNYRRSTSRLLIKWFFIKKDFPRLKTLPINSVYFFSFLDVDFLSSVRNQIPTQYQKRNDLYRVVHLKEDLKSKC